MKHNKPTTHPLSWLATRCRGQLLLLALQVFLNILFAASSVWFALLVRDVIDSATALASGVAEISTLSGPAITLGCLIFVQLLLRFLCRYLGDRLTADFELNLRSTLYRALLRKELGSIGTFHTGDLMTRLYSDVVVIADGAANILPNVAATATRLICAIGVMAFLEWRFTLIFVGGGMVIFAVSRLFSGMMKRMHKEMQQADSRARSFVQESLSSLLVLKVFDAQTQTARKEGSLQNEYFGIRLKKKLIGALAGVGFAAIFKIGYFAALVYCALSLGGVIASASLMTYGTLMAILQLVNQIQAPFGSLSGVLPKFYGMCASVERLQELEELSEDHREPSLVEDATAFYNGLQSIEFADLSFAYEREDIFRDAELSIRKGDFCVITGLSGIGKSTLLKLLVGVYQPKEGRISFSGEFGTLPIQARPDGLFAYVPQGNLLFSGTIRENIAFVRDDATEEEIMEAARIACVTDFLPDLPDGLDTLIGEKGFGLSEGQVQRVAIARALLQGAPILLLDESTSALDEETEHKFLSELSKLSGKTCIIISHKKAAFEICDCEILIADKHIEKRKLAHESE